MILIYTTSELEGKIRGELMKVGSVSYVKVSSSLDNLWAQFYPINDKSFVAIKVSFTSKMVALLEVSSLKEGTLAEEKIVDILLKAEYGEFDKKELTSVILLIKTSIDMVINYQRQEREVQYIHENLPDVSNLFQVTYFDGGVGGRSLGELKGVLQHTLSNLANRSAVTPDTVPSWLTTRIPNDVKVVVPELEWEQLLMSNKKFKGMAKDDIILEVVQDYIGRNRSLREINSDFRTSDK